MSSIQIILLSALIIACTMQAILTKTYTTSACSGFKTFDELNYSTLHRCGISHAGFTFPAFYIEPITPVLLNNHSHLDSLMNTYIGQSNYENGVAYIYNIAGFDLNLRDNSPIALEQYVFLELLFNIYDNGKLLDLTCSNNDLITIFNNTGNVLNYFKKSMIIKNSVYPTNLCPSVFHQFESDDLELYGHQIEFDTRPYPFLDRINSSVKFLYIRYTYRLDLTNKTLHPNVYASSLQSFQISQASIHYVHSEVFKSFTKLRSLDLSIINFRYFYHANQIYWMTYLNHNPNNTIYFLKNNTEAIDYVKSKAVTLSLYVHAIDNDLFPAEFFPYFDYQYTDEDFCLFAPFPHENLLMASITNHFTDPKCSCTMQFILKHQRYYRAIGVLTDYLFSLTNKLCYNTPSSNCSLDKRLEDCEITGPDSTYEAGYFVFYDLKETIKGLQKVVLNILGPMASSIALVTNLATIIIVRRVKKGTNKIKNAFNFHNHFYDYMKWNAAVNLIYATLYLLFYSIKCDLKNENNHGYVVDTCFQEQIYVSIVGSVLKLVANFLFLQMCLNRFILVGKDHSDRLIKLSKTEPRKFLLLSLILSSLLSIIVYFQQQFFGNQTTSPGYVVFEVTNKPYFLVRCSSFSFLQ